MRARQPRPQPEPIIDPALQDPPPVPSAAAGPSRHPSLKRKSVVVDPSTTTTTARSRASTGSNPYARPTSSPVRVTRSGAAIAAAAAAVEVGSQENRGGGLAAGQVDELQRQGQGTAGGESAEPTRGEEENLMGYQWSTKSKRARRSSPKRPARPDPSHAATVPTSPADALFSPDNTLGLPLGVAPFRYPCLHPHLPNPPPGDPTNPLFRPFDPLSPGPDSAQTATPTTIPTPSSDTSNRAHSQLSASVGGGPSSMLPPPGTWPPSRKLTQGGRRTQQAVVENGYEGDGREEMVVDELTLAYYDTAGSTMGDDGLGELDDLDGI